MTLKHYLSIRFVLLFTTLIPISLLTSGCGRVPQPVSYSFSTQQKMQSVEHWNILAEDTAGQLIQTLQSKPTVMKEACLYIKPANTTFGIAFSNLLKANLLHTIDTDSQLLTYHLADEYDQTCIQVDFSTQLIKHRAERTGRVYPGTFTFLTGAVAVMRDFAGYEALVGAGIVADIMGGVLNSVPHSEILVTTKVTVQNRLLSMRTDMYYVNDRDSWHYEKQQPLPVNQVLITGREK